jgi:hypothetical protein
MRHPLAPVLIAILLGFLIFVVVYHYLFADGHHEGNPHPADLPVREEVLEELEEGEDSSLSSSA